MEICRVDGCWSSLRITKQIHGVTEKFHRNRCVGYVHHWIVYSITKKKQIATYSICKGKRVRTLHYFFSKQWINSTMATDNQFIYHKQRREFGQQINFSDKHELLVSMSSDRALSRQYILRDPVTRGTQYATQLAADEINTERATYETHGINHTEGGWPKDICLQDPEQTTRYRRKIEKDELFISQVMGLTKPMEHCIQQNNAINIYEKFFDALEPAPLLDPCTSRTINVYRDPCQRNRPVTHLSWSPDGGTKLAISYCDMVFQSDHSDLANDSFIWEVG